MTNWNNFILVPSTMFRLSMNQPAISSPNEHNILAIYLSFF